MYLFLDRKGIEAYSNIVLRFPGKTGILELFPDRMGIDTFFFYFNILIPGTKGILDLFSDRKGIVRQLLSVKRFSYPLKKGIMYLFSVRKGIEAYSKFCCEIPWYDGNTGIIP